MFATPVFVGTMMVAVAGDPLAAVQNRYPATRTTITTSSGVFVTYSIGADAPVSLRRAYRVLEVAEREFLVSQALQLLEQEYVQNERRLEALRTARTAQYLTSTIYGTRGPLFYSPILLDPPLPAVKWVLLGNLAQGTTANRALAAIDRMALAQYQLQQALLDLAYPNRVKPAAGAAEPPVPQVVLPVPEVVPAVAAPPAPAVVPGSPRDVEQAAAREELAAEERERTARARELAAEESYRTSLPADRDAARKTWLEARDQWEQARRDWDAARQRWQTARDQLTAQRPQPTAFVQVVGHRPPTPVYYGSYPRPGHHVRHRIGR